MSTMYSANAPKSAPTTSTSVAAVTSMVFGIMSPIVLCTCLPTVITSALAIILGHVALFKISRSNGTLLGKRRAVVGLALGYPFLILSLCLIPTYFNRIDTFRQFADGDTSTSNEVMWKAERKIANHYNGIAHGNSSEAKHLARLFSNEFKAMQSQVVVRVKNGKVEEKDQDFVTYCQLERDSICFLTYIPEYRKYDDEAKEAIENVAWLAALEATRQSTLPPTADVGVGLKGIILYGSTIKGKASQGYPSVRSDDRELLEPFFDVPDSNPAMN